MQELKDQILLIYRDNLEPNSDINMLDQKKPLDLLSQIEIRLHYYLREVGKLRENPKLTE